VRKQTLSFVMSVQLSLCPHEVDSHDMDFREVLDCGFLAKFVYILNFWLKSDKNNRHLT